ncbi:hypothetical protein Bbelb_104700 [Branchiostoma belcheri]|nr:hypothetical protein Bbelb_104700 [Branchiostoma belcheri]
MAKPMSLMCLIAIGLLLSFADVNGETMKSTPGVGQTADDTRKGSPKGEDVGNGALKETPETLMAQLGNLKDKLDALKMGVGIFVQGYELYRTSANYKRFKKGEISQEEFESEVRKEVGGVVRSLCSTGGRLGNIFGTFLTGGTGEDVAKGMVLGNGDAGISGLRLLMKVLGDLGRALDVVIKFYPHVSASYERWQNGEISLREFQWEVGRDVVRVGSPMAGTVAGATLGAWYLGPAVGQLAIPIPGLGAFVGGYVGGKVGAMFGELVTG